MSEEVPQLLVVKWFNSTKGFGFLQGSVSGMDVFVHANQLRKSGINRSLVDGEKVRCSVETGPKGVFATNVALVEG